MSYSIWKSSLLYLVACLVLAYNELGRRPRRRGRNRRVGAVNPDQPGAQRAKASWHGCPFVVPGGPEVRGHAGTRREQEATIALHSVVSALRKDGGSVTTRETGRAGSRSSVNMAARSRATGGR